MIKFGKPVPLDVESRLPDLARVLACDPHVDALWLYGSRARGEADSLSDVDLAVLAGEDVTPQELWDRQLEWTALAARTLGTEEVLIEPLNRMRLAQRHAVLRDARLLFARSPERAADFEARTLREYLDLKPYLESYDRDLLAQAASGKLL